jgi:predicted protein tyrosine phosphatase
MKTKILFICMSNTDRSVAAESIINTNYSNNFEAKSSGVGPFSRTYPNSNMISWADVIVCMELVHRDILVNDFPEAINKEIQIWNISSDFMRHDPELENQLQLRIQEYLL